MPEDTWEIRHDGPVTVLRPRKGAEASQLALALLWATGHVETYEPARLLVDLRPLTGHFNTLPELEASLAFLRPFRDRIGLVALIVDDRRLAARIRRMDLTVEVITPRTVAEAEEALHWSVARREGRRTPEDVMTPAEFRRRLRGLDGEGPS
jgi:hypothetical protein